MNVSQFASRYATALVEHVEEQSERSLRRGYELGREAVQAEISVLDVAAAHSDAVARAFASNPDTVDDLMERSGEFLVEVLAPFEMVRRGVPEAQDAANAERRRATMLRRLSELLSDESLASADAATVEELLRLVAEHVLEVVEERPCQVVVDVRAIREPITVGAAGAADFSGHAAAVPGRSARLRIPLLALDGSDLGSIDLVCDDGNPLDAEQQELVRQIAQMAAAMIERAAAYY